MWRVIFLIFEQTGVSTVRAHDTAAWVEFEPSVLWSWTLTREIGLWREYVKNIGMLVTYIWESDRITYNDIRWRHLNITILSWINRTELMSCFLGVWACWSVEVLPQIFGSTYHHYKYEISTFLMSVNQKSKTTWNFDENWWCVMAFVNVITCLC